jgi:hypothetical protein
MKPPSTVPARNLSAASKASTAATQPPKGKTKGKHNQAKTVKGIQHQAFLFRQAYYNKSSCTPAKLTSFTEF